MRNFFSKYTAVVPTIVIGILFCDFGPSLHAQTAPSNYSAYTGTDTKVIPPAPSLGPENSVVQDPPLGHKFCALRIRTPMAVNLSFQPTPASTARGMQTRRPSS